MLTTTLVLATLLLLLFSTAKAQTCKCVPSFVAYAQTAPTASIWNDLQFVATTIEIGDAKFEASTERLVLAYPGGALGAVGGTFFTSYHRAPTGWQDLYIFPADAQPVGFTLPHSAYVPPNATTTGFIVDAADTKFKYDGESRWYGCRDLASAANRATLYWIAEGFEAPAGLNCTQTDIVTYAYGYGYDEC